MDEREKGEKLVAIMDGAARELSKQGFDNVRVSEMFFAYGIRLGLLAEGIGVFDAARRVVDTMERQTKGSA